MSRERPAAGPTMSLFPFIAVLLCTMGALLVLLVIFSRAARQTALVAEAAAGPARQEAPRDEAAAPPPAAQPPIEQSVGQPVVPPVDAIPDIAIPDIDELARSRRALLERIAAAESLKREAEQRLQTARLRLAGIEEHARELKAELDRHVTAIQELQEPGPPPPDDLDELARSLEEAEKALSEARQTSAGRPAAYAVVPYVGPSGTRRRPLYIECSFDGVFLQPEGVRLGPSDFEGPPGPGNPLASALRAAREYLVTTSASGSVDREQPYPLLLVRPSGVMAYYAARESLSSWGSDFGYQFIDEDWTLAFPPADPVLADIEQQAVAEARARLEWLSQRRARVETRPKTTYRAATTRGGVVETGGASLLGDPERFEWRERGDGGAGGGGSGNGPGFAAGSAGASPPRERGHESGFGRGLAATGSGAGPADADGFGPGGGAGGRSAAVLGLPGTAGGSSSAPAGPGGAAGPSQVARSGRGEPGIPGGDPHGRSVAGGSPGGSADSRGGSESAGAAGSGGGDASFSQAGAAAGGASAGSGSQAGAGSGGAAGQAGGGASGSLSVPLAGVRGANWASLATRDRPIPLTRPILVECAADEFRIYDDSRSRVVEMVPIGGATETAVDPLVRHVQQRVASWGIAGDRMYWRPQLVLEETPDGLRRREDLERLLEGSGLDTRVRPPEVAPLPTVRRGTGRTGPHGSVNVGEVRGDNGSPLLAPRPRGRLLRAGG